MIYSSARTETATDLMNRLPLRVLTLISHATGRKARRGANGHEVISIHCLQSWNLNIVVPLTAYSHHGQLVDLVRGSSLWRDYAFSACRPSSGFLQLCRMLRRDSVHVVHSYGPVILDFVAVVAARTVGVRSVVTRPVMIADLRTGIAVKGLLRLLDRLTLGAADRVVATSEYGREMLLAGGCPESRLACIRVGVDVDRFGPGVAPMEIVERWRGDSFTIGMFAQMTIVKRHDLLLKALARAMAEGRDWRVVLAGDGPLRKRLEDLAATLGIGSRVLFLGFVRDTAPAYVACDVITLPSDREGLPTTILEAMACGKPVVASDVAGVKEMLDGVGVMLKANTEEDLFAGLAQLEEAASRENKGRAGRRRVTHEFRLEVMIRRYEKLYMSCFPNPDAANFDCPQPELFASIVKRRSRDRGSRGCA